VGAAAGSSETIFSSETGWLRSLALALGSTPRPTITPARKLRMRPAAPAMK
jgi:hypothetical protein